MTDTRSTETALLEFIRDEIVGEGPDFVLATDEDLLAGGLIGSMDIFRLIEFMEREFDIKVPPAEMTIENFTTVAALTAFVARQKEGES